MPIDITDIEKKKIKEIENEIVNSINPSWTKDQTIRAVYILLGKVISKDIDFFYSLGKKLEDKNYTFKKIKNIYEAKQIRGYSHICKSSAIIIQRILKRLNIKSSLVETTQYNKYTDPKTQSELDIHHYFLAAVGEENRIYFLTIIPDLFNIQFNLKTRHFANNIDYYRIDKDGKKYQVYKGSKINHTVLDDEHIEWLDESIEYIKPYTVKRKNQEKYYSGYNNIFLENLRTYCKMNNYIIERGYDTDFFKDIMNYKVDNLYIEFYLNSKNPDMKEIDEWINFITLKAHTYEHDPKDNKTIEGKIKVLKNSIYENNYRKFRNTLGQLTIHFVDEKYKIGKDNYCSQEYLENKFEYLFPKFFNFNEKSSPLTSSFTGLAEKLDFIDLFIETMFPELRVSNSSIGIKTDNKLNIIRNRIQRYVIYSTKRNQYDIIFSIDNSNNYYHLDPVKGIFNKVTNILDLISDEFIIVTDELKNRMLEVEGIESNNKAM